MGDVTARLLDLTRQGRLRADSRLAERLVRRGLAKRITEDHGPGYSSRVTRTRLALTPKGAAKLAYEGEKRDG